MTHKSPLRRVFHHLQNDKCTGLGHLVVRLFSNKYAWVRQYDLDLDTLSNSNGRCCDFNFPIELNRSFRAI